MEPGNHSKLFTDTYSDIIECYVNHIKNQIDENNIVNKEKSANSTHINKYKEIFSSLHGNILIINPKQLTENGREKLKAILLAKNFKSRSNTAGRYGIDLMMTFNIKIIDSMLVIAKELSLESKLFSIRRADARRRTLLAATFYRACYGNCEKLKNLSLKYLDIVSRLPNAVEILDKKDASKFTVLMSSIFFKQTEIAKKIKQIIDNSTKIEKDESTHSSLSLECDKFVMTAPEPDDEAPVNSCYTMLSNTPGFILEEIARDLSAVLDKATMNFPHPTLPISQSSMIKNQQNKKHTNQFEKDLFFTDNNNNKRERENDEEETMAPLTKQQLVMEATLSSSGEEWIIDEDYHK